MNALAELLGPWLLDLLLSSTVLLAAVLAAQHWASRPESRLALAWGAMLGLLLLAVATALPAWPRLRSTAVPFAPMTEPTTAESAWSVFVETPVPKHATPEVTSQAAANDATTWPVAAWLGGLVLALAWVALGSARVTVLYRRAGAAPAWARRELAHLVGRRTPPGLRVSGGVASAAAFGALRPRILLAVDGLDEGNAAVARAALAHEWAHIRHGDLWLYALERLLLPLYFAQPLFWFLRRGLRLDQELLADAAAAGETPLEYAGALLQWARRAAPPNGLAALALGDDRTILTRRVEMLLQRSACSSRPSRGRGLVQLALVVAVAAGLSFMTLRPESLAAGDKPEVLPPAVAPPAPVADGARQVLIELLEARVSHTQLAREKLTLARVLAEVTGRSEKATVSETLTSPQKNRLLERLRGLDALTVVAEPTLVTLLGRPARFWCGSQLPVLVPHQVGPRVEFRDVGLHVNVTPHLHGEKLVLNTEVTESRLAEPYRAQKEPGLPPTIQAQSLQAGVPGDTWSLLVLKGDVASTVVLQRARFVLAEPEEDQIRMEMHLLGVDEAQVKEKYQSLAKLLTKVAGDRAKVSPVILTDEQKSVFLDRLTALRSTERLMTPGIMALNGQRAVVSLGGDPSGVKGQPTGRGISVTPCLLAEEGGRRRVRLTLGLAEGSMEEIQALLTRSDPKVPSATADVPEGDWAVLPIGGRIVLARVAKVCPGTGKQKP